LDPKNKRILDATRIRAVIPTLNSLSEANLVIGAHQSRLGKYDFTSLEVHAKVLSMYLEKPVLYTDDVIGEAHHRRGFDIGTKELLRCMARCSEYTVV
jgi:phosphoglycerate kinase